MSYFKRQQQTATGSLTITTAEQTVTSITVPSGFGDKAKIIADISVEQISTTVNNEIEFSVKKNGMIVGTKLYTGTMFGSVGKELKRFAARYVTVAAGDVISVTTAAGSNSLSNCTVKLDIINDYADYQWSQSVTNVQLTTAQQVVLTIPSITGVEYNYMIDISYNVIKVDDFIAAEFVGDRTYHKTQISDSSANNYYSVNLAGTFTGGGVKLITAWCSGGTDTYCISVNIVTEAVKSDI